MQSSRSNPVERIEFNAAHHLLKFSIHCQLDWICSVKSIGTKSFCKCISLQDISIPSSVVDFEESVFEDAHIVEQNRNIVQIE
ncbi:hypothetical protein M9Y10_020297 [Tritrichomonas musculus]|uniref:Uncharacterized protein n=1 Tax=Tritrichomonas musculus TaxID=1915356 RepID=A0ABR2HFS0_9EUKA